MRFTRAAKVAAFPLTALILVALVACQGPAGPAGAAGGKGDPGASGSPGSPGTPGISALGAVGGAGHQNTVVAEYISNTVRGEIGPLPTIDLTEYFRGGKGSVTFTVGAPPTDSTFTVEIAKGSTVATVKLREKTTKVANPDHDYLLPMMDMDTYIATSKTTYFTVTATDADKFTATKTLAVLANREPIVSATAGDTEWTLPAPPPDSTAAATGEFYPIGTQNAADTRRDGGTKDERDVGNADDIAAAQKAFVCATFNSCVYTPMVGTNAAPGVHFGDDLYGDDTSLMYSMITARTPVTAVTFTGGATITLTGVKSTWDADKALGAGHVAAEIVVRATDKGSLSVDRTLLVTVDGHPTVAPGLLTTDTVPLPAEPLATNAGADVRNRTILPELSKSFKDLEGLMIFTAESSHPLVASIVDTNGAGDAVGQAGIGDSLTIMALTRGTATLTVTATDTLGQTATHTITVSVSRP